MNARMSNSVICDRSFEFASLALRLCDRIWERGPSGRHLASQLMRSATSIGSNAEEAQEAQTKADVIAKMSISRKEARETTWWLRLTVKNGIAATKDVEWELSEAQQLLRMIRSAILTARASSKRGSHTHD
jgi:four helix bundle protein